MPFRQKYEICATSSRKGAGDKVSTNTWVSFFNYQQYGKYLSVPYKDFLQC